MVHQPDASDVGSPDPAQEKQWIYWGYQVVFGGSVALWKSPWVVWGSGSYGRPYPGLVHDLI